eukprot:bmy_19623T0
MWHPAIYRTGDVGISVPRPPQSMTPSERRSPAQNVRTLPRNVRTLPENVRTLPLSAVSLRHGPNASPRRRGRLRDARQAGREQRLGPREHGQHPEAGPGDHGARGAGRRAGAHHARRVLREDQDPGAHGDGELFHEDGEAEADRCFWDDSQDSGTEEP